MRFPPRTSRRTPARRIPNPSDFKAAFAAVHIFPQEEELAEKSARLAELNAQLDVDEKSHEPEQEEEPDEDAPRRPSVLAALEEKSDKPEPVKPFRSYYDKDGDAR